MYLQYSFKFGDKYILSKFPTLANLLLMGTEYPAEL